MVYEVRRSGAAFNVVCVIANGVIRIVAVRHEEEDANRMAGDLERFNALFEPAPRA